MAKTDGPASATPAEKAAGKGAPTPKRKDQEQIRRRPLVVNTKEDAKRRREEDRAKRDREYQAMLSGDDRNMPLEHRGPERRYVRDFVDSRITVGEFILPISVAAMFVLVFFDRFPEVITMAGLVLVLILGAWIIESFVLVRRLKRQMTAKFGAARIPTRVGFYAFSRLTQVRQLRMPKPQVRRGEHPA